MQVQFLLGPAGSGKTFRCLAEIRQALRAAPEGPPLLLIAPKQTTYQLERQLLSEPDLPGYTRLHILSFDRLARFVFDRLHATPPRILDEEGRLMVLRSLLAKKRRSLKLFRASARLTGFARQLSLVLSELQRHRLAPDSLRALAASVRGSESLALKLQDLALLLEDYLAWLAAHNLQDNERLLTAATEVLAPEPKISPSFRVEQIWVDGFAEFSPQELELLAALMLHCDTATVTLCLDNIPGEKRSWLSTWSAVQKTFEECRKRFDELPGANHAIELLRRHPARSRFRDNPVLRHLEEFWAEGQPCPSNLEFPSSSLRAAACADPEAEATFAAREILNHVQRGGRYRDVTVLVRTLDHYHQPLQRIFSRYAIPFFLDRRESVSHHPLAELTRSALRTIVFGWKHEDWFAALKTGLVRGQEKEIDELENEALARGWKGGAWHQPIRLNDKPYSESDAARLRALEARLENLRNELVPPFERFELSLATLDNRPKGTELAAIIRALWDSLGVESRLEEWAAAPMGQADSSTPVSVHATVWEQMNAWLENLELAFSDEALPLREWLPILEAGMSNLTVGVIPPALDQVLIGAVDRSRNPEVKFTLVLGMNETMFPASPAASALLTDADHTELEKHGVALAANARFQLTRERFYAYLACTRGSERLVLTSAQQSGDLAASPLNPSPFLSHVQQLFPKLEIEKPAEPPDWRESLHASELIVPLLRLQAPGAPVPMLPAALRRSPAVVSIVEQMRHLGRSQVEELLPSDLATQLYGPILRTSVSRMEQFAACPFRFFVHSGLRAEERKLFELDVREQGTFQHDALAAFHEELRSENKRWRDITPIEARQRLARIATVLMASYRDGLLQASEQSRFMASTLSDSLQDFIETIVGWMRRQYLLDPVAVELPFGTANSAPAWELELGGSQKLALRGRIDRIDVYPHANADTAYCVIMDYKSSHRKLDPVLITNGLQLQLLAYLNVVCQWTQPKELFGASQLVPAGVFYINLRGSFQSVENRRKALAPPEQPKDTAYRHSGRFDAQTLRILDSRKDAMSGDQFSYRLRKDGDLNKASREALTSADFEALLASVASILRDMGQKIFSGVIKLDPYRKGQNTACDQCDYRSICRIDPWTHTYRVLRQTDSSENSDNAE